ncbi:Phenolic glucoside malonyltransferase 1, partial [Cucurbita argyrosperma subsp. argyrosperma]
MLDEISERWKKAMPIDKFVLVAGSPRLGVYDIDFGWGRSKKVELASISPNGVFSMAESRNGMEEWSLELLFQVKLWTSFALYFQRR